MQWLLCLLFACDAGVPVEKPLPPDPDLIVVRLDDWHGEASDLGGMHYTFSSGKVLYHGGAHGFSGIPHVLPLPIEGDGEQLRGAYYVAKLGPYHGNGWVGGDTQYTGDVVQLSRPMTEAEAKAALANHTAELPYDFAEPIVRHPQHMLLNQPVTEYVVVQLVASQSECSNAGGTHYVFSTGGAQFHGGGHGFWSFNAALATGRFYVAEIQRVTEPATDGNPGWCLEKTPTYAGEVLSVLTATDESDAKAKLAAIPNTGFSPTVQLR